MRTTEQIKKEMTDAVLANSTLADAFGLDPNRPWDEQVSTVNLLNLIIYIVAMAARTVEWLHDRFRAEVEDRIAAALPGTISWYWNKVMQFQYGSALNDMAAYANPDPSRNIVAHCAVTEIDNGIVVKVHKEGYAVLEPGELEALRAYVAAVKFAGTQAFVYSYPSDTVTLRLSIWRDPMVLDENGCARDATHTPVVENAVRAYLDGIVYGGTLNKTRLIDAVQQVEGIVDAVIDEENSYIDNYANDITVRFDEFVQNYTAGSGHFELLFVACNDMTTNP